MESSERNILVSVCMITYGHAKYIKQAIEGVLMQQTNFEFELIVADDCSPDQTKIIVDDIISNHLRGNVIKYIRRKKNLGMMPNFINTISLSSAKYIALCEGDDFWTDQNKLQKQFDLLETNKSFSISYHNCKILDTNGVLQSMGTEFKHLTTEMIFRIPSIPTSTVMYKNIVHAFPEEFFKTYNGDTFLFCLIANETKMGAFYHSDIGPSIYRQHTESIWSSLRIENKYEHSSKTLFTIYKLFKDYRNNLKIRLHEMLNEAITLLKVPAFLRYYFRYIKFLVYNKEFGLVLLSAKSIFKRMVKRFHSF